MTELSSDQASRGSDNGLLAAISSRSDIMLAVAIVFMLGLLLLPVPLGSLIPASQSQLLLPL